MTDAADVRKRKSTRFIILAAIAAVIIGLVTWWYSRDSNDGPATGITESGVVTFEGTPPDAVGVGAPARDLPGANNRDPNATLGTEGGGAGSNTGPAAGTNPMPSEGAAQ